jgi:hypothetical protein
MAPLSPNMLIDPPAVRKILEDGWTKYFSIALLTNDKCRAVQFIDHVPENTLSLASDGKFLVQATGLSATGKCNISIEHWREASSRLVRMCSHYLSIGSGSAEEREVAAGQWSQHFEQIKNQVDFAKHFNLYLQYDIYIRQMWASRTAEFNPGVFHTRVYLDMWRTNVTSSLSVPRAARTVPAAPSRPFRAAGADGKASSASANSAASCKCFICGSTGHNAKSSTCTPLWLLRGKDGRPEGPGNVTVIRLP